MAVGAPVPCAGHELSTVYEMVCVASFPLPESSCMRLSSLLRSVLAAPRAASLVVVAGCVAITLATFSSPATAQPKGPTTLAPAGGKSLSAEVMRSVAEAVDGYRGWREAFVVANSGPGDAVLAVFPKLKDAEEFATKYGANAIVIPGIPPLDPGGFAVCPHMIRSVVRPQLCARPTQPMPIGAIAGMTLVIRGVNGQIDSVAVPNDADALFLRLAAIDKFAIPYYTRIVGAEKAAAMRADFVKSFERRP